MPPRKNDESTDLCILSIGYQSFVVPMDSAITFFKTMTGQEIYQYRTTYEDGETIPIISEAKADEIKISHISPSFFFLGRERHKQKQEEEAAKQRAEKEAKAK